MRTVLLWIAFVSLFGGGGCGPRAQSGSQPLATPTRRPAASGAKELRRPQAPRAVPSASAAGGSPASDLPATASLDSELPCGAPLTPEECRYVGRYRQGSVDSVSQLAILDDHTFCYGFMGGSLDMLIAGRWEMPSGAATGIHLREVRPERDWFVLRAREDGIAGETGKVVFAFRGATMGNARGLAFAVSSSAATPAALRPLFGRSDESWGRYELPAMEREKARYVFIGATAPRTSTGTERVFVTQYEIGPGKLFTFAYDEKQASAVMDANAELEGEVLRSGRRIFGIRMPLTSRKAAELRRSCVEPRLREEPPQAEPLRYRGEDEIWTKLTPIRSFYVGREAVQGQPWLRNEKNRSR